MYQDLNPASSFPAMIKTLSNINLTEASKLYVHESQKYEMLQALKIKK